MRSFVRLWPHQHFSKSKASLSAFTCIFVFSLAALTIRANANAEQTLTVAVASNFYFPLTNIIERSAAWDKNKVKLVSGSSGVLYAQTINGAPFDIFLSADTERPLALFEQGMSQAPENYAQGKLVLWPADQVLSIEQNLSARKGRIAIANPQTAPFGAAASAYLKTLSTYQALSQRFVYGNNISQTFQFIDTGNADLGLVAKSMLIQAQDKFPDKYEHYASFIEIPHQQYPSIIQQGVVLTKVGSDKHKLATEFMTYLLSDEVQEQLVDLGYMKAMQEVEPDKQGDE